MHSLGIDIGGSGIKGAIVDTETGEFHSERIRIATPERITREGVLGILNDLLKQLNWNSGPVGIGFPGVVQQGVIKTAANLDSCLVDWNLKVEMESIGVGRLRVINDADAAGVAEVHLGAGRAYGRHSVLMITVGTGIGVALFTEHRLVPNLELGHMEFKGTTVEKYAAERIRKAENLSWETWGTRFNEVLEAFQFLLNPDLIILGGGGVKKPESFQAYLNPQLPLAFAQFGNRAGIIGAALQAVQSE